MLKVAEMAHFLHSLRAICSRARETAPGQVFGGWGGPGAGYWVCVTLSAEVPRAIRDPWGLGVDWAAE